MPCSFIPKGTKITQYCGKLLSLKQIEEMEPSSRTHVISMRGRGGGLDGVREPIDGVGFASFANHSKKNANAEIKADDDGLFLYSIRDIESNRWITFNYGNSFLKDVKGACHDFVSK